jgi:hypothetical protein
VSGGADRLGGRPGAAVVLRAAEEEHRGEVLVAALGSTGQECPLLLLSRTPTREPFFRTIDHCALSADPVLDWDWEALVSVSRPGNSNNQNPLTGPSLRRFIRAAISGGGGSTNAA